MSITVDTYGVCSEKIRVCYFQLKSLKAIQLNLRRLRALRGWTQVQAAEQARTEYKHYQKIETGGWAGLQLSTVENLAAAFGVEPWELLAPPTGKVGVTRAAKRKPQAVKAKANDRDDLG